MTCLMPLRNGLFRNTEKAFPHRRKAFSASRNGTFGRGDATA